MEAVRLIDGKECQTLEKSEIIALIEALCERPLEDGQADPPAELQAFYREAAKALSQAGNASTRREPDTLADADRYTAALAALLSGSDAEPARRTVAEATLRSAAARLDAGSALAFVDAIEQSPQTAPSHLVEEMLEADRAAATGLAPRQGAGISAVWRWIPGAWSARTRRMAAACTVLMVAGVASWSVYRLETDFSCPRLGSTDGRESHGATLSCRCSRTAEAGHRIDGAVRAGQSVRRGREHGDRRAGRRGTQGERFRRDQLQPHA